MTSGERKDRDDLIRFSVMRLRMTVPQIMEFSKMWLHPFSDEANVWRRLRKLRLHPATTRGITLDKKVMHVHRQSRHDEDTIRLCLKIWGDASRNKIRITEIDREKPVGYQSGIRPDMAFRLNGYLYYVEVQRSSMTFRGWKTKLGKYRTFRKKKETKPFRTIVVMEDQRDLNTAYRYGKEVMQKHPDLCLFYFGWLPDILGQYDVCTEDVWVTNRLIDFNGVFSDEGKPEVIPLVL